MLALIAGLTQFTSESSNVGLIANANHSDASLPVVTVTSMLHFTISLQKHH